MPPKKFMIIPREQSINVTGFETEHGHRDFNGNSYLHVSDPAEAREIDQKYGCAGGTREVYVAEDAQYTRAMKNDGINSVHNYFFSGAGRARVNVHDDPEYTEIRPGVFRKVWKHG